MLFTHMTRQECRSSQATATFSASAPGLSTIPDQPEQAAMGNMHQFLWWWCKCDRSEGREARDRPESEGLHFASHLCHLTAGLCKSTLRPTLSKCIRPGFSQYRTACGRVGRDRLAEGLSKCLR